MKQAAIVLEQNAKLSPANAGGVLQHRPEHGASSPGELEMTRRTSEVAACCSSASFSSRVSTSTCPPGSRGLASFMLDSSLHAASCAMNSSGLVHQRLRAAQKIPQS